MLLKKVYCQLLREYLRVRRLVRSVCVLSVIDRIRIVGLEFFSSVLNDALRHLHCKRVCIVALVYDGDRFCQAEVALCRVDIVDRKSVRLVSHRLLAETESDRTSPARTFLSGAEPESSRWSPTFS